MRNDVITKFLYYKNYLDNHFINEYFTIECLSSGTLTWNYSSDAIAKTIYYSTNNGSSWNSITSSANGALIANIVYGDKIIFKGTETSYKGSCFGGTATIKVYGNSMSLLYGDNFRTQSSLPATYEFTGLFENHTSLTKADKLKLPANIVNTGSYENMFYGCSSLSAAPELPAIYVDSGSYAGMFQGCSSLLAAPELPAIGGIILGTFNVAIPMQAYAHMFHGCSSLLYPPSELPATAAELSSYNTMFAGCSSITYSPIIKAAGIFHTTCENMFYGCSNLTKITCYSYYILNHEVPPTDEDIKKYAFLNWVHGVNANGTFYYGTNTNLWVNPINSDSGIPSGWTRRKIS